MPTASQLPTPRSSLPAVKSRISFLYVERCAIDRKDNGLELICSGSHYKLPSAQLACLLLGPGTSITHEAMKLLAETNTTFCTVGESGVRTYSSVRPAGASHDLLLRQAKVVSNTRLRAEVARKMYTLRFGGEDVAGLPIRDLLGREGARMRRAYRENAARTGVPWEGKDTGHGDFTAADPINQALMSASQVLYGVATAVINALGLSPALGIIHSGSGLAFVLDVADFYKVELGIPTAFDVIASGSLDPAGDTRRAMRDAIVQTKLIPRMVKDIYAVLGETTDDVAITFTVWDGIDEIEGGYNHARGGS